MQLLLDPRRHVKPVRFFLAVNGSEVKWLALMCLSYGFATLSMLTATYFLGRIVDFLTTASHPNLGPYVLGIVVMLVCYEVGFRLGHIIEVLVTSRMRARNKKALFDHTASLSFGYFADRFAGEIAHKITKTTDAVERLTIIITNTGIEDGVLFLISAATVAFVHPYLGLYVIVWLALFLSGSLLFVRMENARANAYATEEARTTGTLVDLYTNVAAMKVYGRENSRERAYLQIDREARSYRRLGIAAVFAYNYLGVSIIILGTGLLLITTHLWLHASITIGGIVFVSGVALRLLMNVWDLGRNIQEFIREHGEAVQNLSDLIVAPLIKDGTHREAAKPEHLGVEYRNVTFGYGKEHPVLKDFSFTVAAGEKVGIVGLSGAGKTTFANLLLRFFDPEKGAIYLNGKDTREFTQEYLRSHISYISQDTSLFHMTIAENIGYGISSVTDAEIHEAARLAYADEFIIALPNGYESVVGERGIKLSGGQRQRIAIARAILADRPLFLLDEATSALDSDSEAKIQKGLLRLMEGKTVIAIAHRLSTLSHLNRIIYLEDGVILEDGSHAELLAKEGKYAKLWHMQAGGFLPDELSSAEAYG